MNAYFSEKSRLPHILLIVVLLLFSFDLYSQNFGQNKPSYKRFDFNVYQTPNFEIYHYLTNDSIVSLLGNLSEKWYKRHQKIFNDTIPFHNPVIIYESHPEFQQTTAISGSISIGTQGVDRKSVV